MAYESYVYVGMVIVSFFAWRVVARNTGEKEYLISAALLILFSVPALEPRFSVYTA